MTHRALTAFLFLALTPAVPGCNGTPYSAPAAPSPSPSPGPVAPPPSVTPPAPVPSAYSWSASASLTGLVFERTPDGPRPIAGVDVYCEQCGQGTHTWSITDANGFYSFTDGVWTEPSNFPTKISVEKDGFGDPPGLPRPTPPNPATAGWREVVIVGATRFDMELVRR